MATIKQTQRETAYLYIRKKLSDGELVAGTRLSPASLAREIGVSPVPVREAISQLKTEGMVDHHAHRGAFVRKIDRQELVEMIEMRSMIECHAAAHAARRISASQLKELDERYEDLHRVAKAFNVAPGTDLRGPLANWHLADLAFHNVLLKAAGNRHAIRFLVLARVMTQMFGYRTDSPAMWADPPAFGAKSVALHVPIYEAIRRHDPKAARRAMQIHMRASRKNILSRFDWLSRHGSSQNSQVEEFPEALREMISDLQQSALADQTGNAADRSGPQES